MDITGRAFGALGLLLSLARLYAQLSGPELKIEVHIYDYSGVSADVLTRAEQETARIYGRVGVEMEWRNCARTAEEAAQNPICELLPGSATRLTLRLLSNAMAQKLHRDSNVHGLALVREDGGFGEEAYVFADHARDLAAGEELQSLILGDLIAHELGHLLLGEGWHNTDGGIMHIPWGNKELEQARQGVLLFGPVEKERIRAQALARGLSVGQPATQTTTWEQLTVTGTELHAKGQYAEAELAFRQALEKAEESADPRRIARSLNDLAVVLYMRGDLAHADEMFRRAVAIWEALPEPANLAAGLANLASLFSEEAQYDRAEPLARRALEMQLQISGPGDSKVASMLETLGDIQIGLGQYADAESTLQKGARGTRESLEPNGSAVDRDPDRPRLCLRCAGAFPGGRRVLPTRHLDSREGSGRPTSGYGAGAESTGPIVLSRKAVREGGTALDQGDSSSRSRLGARTPGGRRGIE